MANAETGGALTDDIRILLERELESFIAEIELFPDDLTPWQVLPGVTNSAAGLALHVSGGLQHFVGAVLGRTGYVRDRDREFATTSGARAGVVEELRAAIAVVNHVLPTLTDASLREPFPAAPQKLTVRTDRFLLHLVAHLAYHLGQAGYLRRMLTGDARSSRPLSIGPLVEPTPVD